MPEDIIDEEVKEVETVEVTPTTDDELVEGSPEPEEKETPEESSTEEKPDDEVEEKEELHGRKTVQKEFEDEEEPKPVEGETPRERALRKEVERVKGLNRQLRGGELLKEVKEDTTQKPEVNPDKKKVLDKYNSQELENLKEVLVVMADDLGFVKKDEFQKTTNQKIASDLLDGFLEKHPMYLPENDPDNVMWNRFKEEFSLYKQPSNPKDFAKIFSKIHKEITGSDSEGQSLNKINAQKEKIKVASHSGSSSKSGKSTNTSSTISGREHLKGFTDEELDEMFGEEE